MKIDEQALDTVDIVDNKTVINGKEFVLTGSIHVIEPTSKESDGLDFAILISLDSVPLPRVVAMREQLQRYIDDYIGKRFTRLMESLDRQNFPH